MAAPAISVSAASKEMHTGEPEVPLTSGGLRCSIKHKIQPLTVAVSVCAVLFFLIMAGQIAFKCGVEDREKIILILRMNCKVLKTFLVAPCVVIIQTEVRCSYGDTDKTHSCTFLT